MSHIDGVGALFSIIVILLSFQTAFAGCGSRLLSRWGSQKHPVGSEGFVTSHNWVDSKIYVHSDAIFGKMHQMIQGAEKHVYLQTWTFFPGTKPTLYLADAIRKLQASRKKKGLRSTVHFWLMLNIIAVQNEDNQRRKVEKFIREQGLELEGIEFHIGFFKANLLGANHAKTVSVDNKVALVTGANFSPNNNGQGYFDLGFVVKGDVLKNLDYDFVQTWMSFVDKDNRPTEWGAQRGRDVSDCTPLLFSRSKPFPDFSERIQNSSMNLALLESVRNAKKSIDIITPNLNVTSFMDELAKAVLRGVKVRIILSKGFTDGSQSLPTRGGTNDMTIDRLHRALTKYTNMDRICQALQIHWYSLDGRSPVDSKKPPASHAKFMLVDDQIAFFGSANMDNQSWVNSKEVALFVDKSSLARRWARDFFNPVFQRSVPVEDCL